MRPYFLFLYNFLWTRSCDFPSPPDQFSPAAANPQIFFLSQQQQHQLVDSCRYCTRFANVRSSVQTRLSQSSPVLSCFILPFDSYSASPSSLFSSPSLDNRERDEGMEGEKVVINRPDAMWLHQIQPSSRQELICLNPSHCSTATIWMPGQRRIGLLRCNLCCLRSSWLVTLSRYLRRGAVFTGAGGQRGH